MIALLLLVAACASSPEPSAPPAPAPAATPEPAPAPAPAPTPPVVPPSGTEPTPTERADAETLMESVASVPYIVRGRVIEVGDTARREPNGRASYHFVIVEITAYIKGDPAAVHAGYQQRFPVYSMTGFMSDNGGHGDGVPRAETQLVVGDERLFLMVLPSSLASSRSDRGPPEPLASRFGPYHVQVRGLLDVARADAVRIAMRLQASEQSDAEQRAMAMTESDVFTSFVAALPAGRATTAEGRREIADRVRDFVLGQFRDRLSVQLAFRAPTVEAPSATHARFIYPFRATRTGAPTSDGTLEVLLRVSDGMVGWWDVAWPGLVAFETSPTFDPAAAIADATSALALTIQGGEPEREAARSNRGDGLDLISVEWRAGRSFGPSGSSGYVRSVTLQMTPQGLAIHRYGNGWLP